MSHLFHQASNHDSTRSLLGLNSQVRSFGAAVSAWLGLSLWLLSLRYRRCFVDLWRVGDEVDEEGKDLSLPEPPA